MQVVILCGGKGTRAYPYTEHVPKAMMTVGGAPILLHVMRLYAAQGHRQFILSLGYRKEVIVDYFRHKQLPWEVQFIDTGDETDTGGRIRNLAPILDERFMATYVDGLSDVPLAGLLAFHEAHGALVTVTTTPLVSQYGTVEAGKDGRIRRFREKPVLRQHWINAGFFIFQREALDHWEGDNLERDVLPAMVRKGLVYAYRHDGFFKSMDTQKDQQEIDTLCRGGKAPWRIPGDEEILSSQGGIVFRTFSEIARKMEPSA
ncbi:MAG: NTP transferase domain-containing protein [Planctomycetes bacterium]|nr:NTP transferase domain-containing protein [Planctomycetota bacterium]